MPETAKSESSGLKALALGQTMLQRAQLALRAGFQFGGARDLYKVFGWNRNPTSADLMAKYKRDALAARVVDMEPDATWNIGPTIESDESFMEVWNDLIARNNFYQALHRLDKLTGLGNYAILLVGLDDGRSLETPALRNVTSGAPRNKVIYLQPYSQASVSIHSLDQNTSSPRFGKPEVYEVTPSEFDSPNVKTGQRSSLLRKNAFKVHHSRVIHVAESVLEDETFGTPRLLKVHNSLDDLAKIVGGSAETFWLAGNRGLHLDVDKDMSLNEQDAEDLSDEVDEYMHELRRVIRTRGVNVKPLGSDVANPTNAFDVVISVISGTTGIPKRILIGSEAGQLASEQDRANWAEKIEQRRNLYAEPYVLRRSIQNLVSMGVLPTPSSLSISWPEAFRLSPLERSMVSAQKARSTANLIKMFESENEEAKNLMSREEARAIIGFGDVEPIFDDKEDTTSGIE